MVTVDIFVAVSLAPQWTSRNTLLGTLCKRMKEVQGKGGEEKKITFVVLKTKIIINY